MADKEQTSSQASKKSSNKLLIVGCTCLILIVLAAICGIAAYFLLKLDGGERKDPVSFDVETGDVATGAASSTIGVDGGEVTVDDSASSLNGMKILIDEGLMEEDEEITISYLPVTSINIPEYLNRGERSSPLREFPGLQAEG